MGFVKDHIQARKGESTMPSSLQCREPASANVSGTLLTVEDEETQIFSQSLPASDLTHEQSIPVDHEETIDVCMQEVPDEGTVTAYDLSPAPSGSSSINSGPSRKRRKVNSDMAPLFEKADTILNTVQSRLGSQSRSESGTQLFVRFLAEQLEKIHDEELRLVTQHKLQTVVMEAQLQDMRKRRPTNNITYPEY
ncbi:uncharacterized protein LOC134530270 [Bacillus rossius redtenbacheri]|uniref:uncharacterized protein LOC134530270 n=1 Tax=Bacillus rossius redtenbacheri TaxID=93214 RepID=UPI002FDCFE11